MIKYSYLILVILTVALCFGACCNGSENSDNHSFFEWDTLKQASCSEKGLRMRTCRWCEFHEYEDIEMLPHTVVVDEAVPATCTTEGLTQGEHCSVCNQILVNQESITQLDHTEVIDPSIPSTCTSDGKLEGKHCAVCGLIIVEQVIVPKSGHTVVIDPAVLPTHETDGLSEGMHCSVCDLVIVEQTVITKLCHEVNIIPATLPTCTSDGLSEGMYCSVCNQVLVERVIIPKLNHMIVYDQAVLPTCTSDGKSEGAHCSTCQEVLIPQIDISATGHSYDEGVILEEAFFWEGGKIKYTCTVNQCGYSYEEEYSVTTVENADENITLEQEKLYSFCAISDVHVTYETSEEDFQRALTYAADNCEFTCIAGDLTDSAAAEWQLAEYKRLVDTYSKTKPVYAIAGNHDHYSNYSYSYLENYTGYPLYYSFTKGNDVFIMVGHYGGYAGDGIGWLADESWSVEELQWLYETLEANRNKRCFVITHVLPHEHGVGNPGNSFVTAGKPLLWNTNDGGIGQAFINLLKHYKNVILFHGHSHTRFSLQELASDANCSDSNGYRSVHIPSLTAPRDVINGTLASVYSESEGYIVDVYDDCIVLKGRDFVDNDGDGNWIDDATYKIDTTLYTIEPNTFVDDTGIIQVAP